MSDIIDIPPEMTLLEARSFRLKSFSMSSVGMFTQEPSPFNLVKRWEAKLTFLFQEEPDWREWDGIIAALGGATGKFRIVDPARRQPYYNTLVARAVAGFSDDTGFSDGTGFATGPLPPTCTVIAAAARGDSSLVLGGGLPVSATAVLRRGDVFEVRPDGMPTEFSHYYLVTKQANTDSSGQTRVQFDPPLRAGAVAGDMVVITDPKPVMRLASDDEGEINVTAPNLGRFGISIMEVLPRP